MKATAIQNNKTANRRIFVLFVLLVLSGARMFGQEAKAEAVNVVLINTNEAVATGEHTDSQMELVSWFMGSKQSQMSHSGNTTNCISTNKTGKKQFINNGLTTNRILSRTFLKKAVNHDSTIA
jgi:hypothetical protein